MNYLSYFHKNFGLVSMRIHAWEVASVLNLIASINANEEIISHVTIKGI
jgi:hypothetical protein